MIKGGDGTPGGAGRCLVDGWDVINESSLTYTAQPLYNDSTRAALWGVDPLLPLNAASNRTDLVYLDVWEREVVGDDDRAHMINPVIGVETCVRIKRQWVVRVAEGVAEDTKAVPQNLRRARHAYYPLARLHRKAGQASIDTIDDLRRSGLGVLSEALTIKDGKVGIGTKEPNSALSISANDKRQISTTRWADLSANSSGWGLFAGNAYVTYDGANHFNYANSHEQIGALGFAVNYPDWNKASVISSGTTSATAGASFQPLTIATFTHDGKVGIGTTDPQRPLHVRGFLALEGSDHTYIEYYPDGFGSGRKAWLGFGNANDNNLTICNEIASANIILQPNGGSVGIGTLDPKNRLDVAGSVVIGANSAGKIAAPNNGLRVDGNITWQGDKADEGCIYLGSLMIRWKKEELVVPVNGLDYEVVVSSPQFRQPPAVMLSISSETIVNEITANIRMNTLTATKFTIVLKNTSGQSKGAYIWWMAIGVY